MRIALIGAFPFPYPQGSQVYFEEQRRALQEAGAEPVRVTYPAGSAAALGRSGPSLAKPFADAGLAARYVSAHRRHPFDVALAHNAEAAVAAILARTVTGVPVVYVAHTILEHELSAYAGSNWRTALEVAGRQIDRFIAKRANGIVALSDDAREMLAAHARCPIRVIAPGLHPSAAPGQRERHDACQRANVSPGRFVLYAGNVDGYQDLELLDAAARLLPSDMPVVLATHDVRDAASRLPHLKIAPVSTFEQTRALCFAAEALVLTRRRPGGFPIKLLNYMETGRPIVAFARIAPGLEDGISARLLQPDAGERELASALRDLREDPEAAASLAAAARLRLEKHHAWPELAARTLEFAQQVASDS